MVKALILIVIFLVIVYVYSSRKLKRTKENTKNIDTVKDFHETYSHLTGMQNNYKQRKLNESGQYNKYVTKYNSSEDYRER